MAKFQTASRTDAERAEHKTELNSLFTIAGEKGKLNSKGLKELHEKRFDIAETIVELIKDDLTVVDPTPFLAEKKSQAFVDKALFQRLDGTLKVTNRAYGSKPVSSRLTSSEYTFSTSMKEIAVELPLEEVVGGHITPSQVVEAVAFAIARYKVATVLDAIDTAVTATADRTGISGYNLRYSTLTEANLQKAVDGLFDNGERPTIFGRHTALYPTIRAFSGWSTEQKGEFTEKGQVGSYLGAPIVTLLDKYSRLTGGHGIARDRLWVAAAETGAWLVEKDVSFLNWSLIDERTSTFSFGIRLEDGVFVYDAQKYRMIDSIA